MKKLGSSCVISIADSPKPPEKSSSEQPHHRIRPNPSLLLRKCTHLIQFQQVHAQIIKSSLDHTDTHLAKLIESLVSSAQIDYARATLLHMDQPPAFAFNTLVRGYADAGSPNEGLAVYGHMRRRGIEPDRFTYPFLLKACSDVNQGKAAHALVVKSPEFGSEIHSLTSLITFYCNSGDIEDARKVFDRMPERNVVTWTAMINGYVKHKRYNEGLALFQEMRIANVELNELTLVLVLSASANLGVYEIGKWVHQYMDKKQIFMNPTLASALIDMYAKCGSIELAHRVFQHAPSKSVSTWNSMISGLAIHGYGHEAIDKFHEMQEIGTKPDNITFIGVLSSCSHVGFVQEGKEIFNSMRRDHGIEPNIKHYGCLIDLLCRAGKLEEAYETMINMPMEPNAVLWGTLLAACAEKGSVELAEMAMEELVRLEPCNDGNYVMMSNVYAANGRWEEAVKVRKAMREKEAVRNPGTSLIEVDNVVHEFMVGDGRHCCSEEIYSMLECIGVGLGSEGYVPELV